MITRVEFTRRMTELLVFALDNGIAVQVDYVKRSREEQRRLIDAGKSWTMRSDHLVGKAVDLHIVEDGKVLWESPLYETLASFWKALGPKYYWGGDFGGKKKDVYHYGVKT